MATRGVISPGSFNLLAFVVVSVTYRPSTVD
jgi:hypothetical protein